MRWSFLRGNTFELINFVSRQKIITDFRQRNHTQTDLGNNL